MSRFLTPFRVGLVGMAAIAALAVLMSFVGKQKFGDANSYPVKATFKDASGLGPKSRVQIAGIEVGEVERVELTPGAEAEVQLRIDRKVVLHADARVTKRSVSLLGDFILDIFPGSESAPLLESGGRIDRVQAQPGMEDVLATMADVARDIQGVSAQLNKLLAGEGPGTVKGILGSISQITDHLDATIVRTGQQLESTMANFEVFSGDVREMTREQRRNIEAILANTRRFTEEANGVLATLDRIVGNGEGEVRDGLASVRTTLEKLERAVEGAGAAVASAQKGIEGATELVGSARKGVDAATGVIESAHKGIDGATAMFDSARKGVDETREVIARVDRGEGTIGMLLREDGIGRKIDKALGDVGTLIAPIAETKAIVHLREEVHWSPRGMGGNDAVQGKSVVQVRLAPKPDKYYAIELARDHRGTVNRQIVTRERSPPAAAEVGRQEEVVTVTNDDLRWSAYFAKRFGPATFRVGMIESSGGGGVDLHAFDDRLRVSLDAFEFAKAPGANPRLRLSAQATFLDYLYLGAGVDDILNDHLSVQGTPIVGRDLFISGGIVFNDDDLKSLLAVVGIPGVK